MGYLLTWKDTHDLVILSYETCYDFDYVNVYLYILKNLKDFFLIIVIIFGCGIMRGPLFLCSG